MFKCSECGYVFEGGDAKIVVEMHGFTDGKGEEVAFCPVCGEGIEEAEQCECCFEWFTKDEIEDGVCKDCLKENVDKKFVDFDFCVKIGETDKTKVEVNGAIASLWSQNEINEILIEEAKKIKDISFEKYAKEDLSWFEDWVREEIKK